MAVTADREAGARLRQAGDALPHASIGTVPILWYNADDGAGWDQPGWHPAWNGIQESLTLLAIHRARNRKKQADHNDRHGGDDLRPREAQHRQLNLSHTPCRSYRRRTGPSRGGRAGFLSHQTLTGSLLERTSEIMARATFTFTPSAISTSTSAESSTTFVTLPIMPPEVTTVSPRRTFLIISW